MPFAGFRGWVMSKCDENSLPVSEIDVQSCQAVCIALSGNCGLRHYKIIHHKLHNHTYVHCIAFDVQLNPAPALNMYNKRSAHHKNGYGVPSELC